MKDLKYAQETAALRHRPAHKRPFFKLAAPVLATLLSITSPAAVLTMPKKAVAEDVQICGRKLQVVRLEKTVAQMDAETAPFRYVEAMPENSVSGGYMNAVVVPRKVTFGVVGEKNKWRITIAFPKNLDKTSSGVAPGTREIDIAGFASYVKKLSSKKMERVYIVLEFGAFEYKGKNTEYVTAHIYPLSRDGKFITRLKDGDVVYGVSYYDGRIFNAGELLIEPTSKRSSIGKQGVVIARN